MKLGAHEDVLTVILTLVAGKEGCSPRVVKFASMLHAVHVFVRWEPLENV